MDIRYDNMFDFISKKYKYDYLKFRPRYGWGGVNTNYVDVSGIVVRKHKRKGRLAAYCEIEELRDSGVVNTLKVWNISNSIREGTRIRVIGKIKNYMFDIGDGKKKFIAGVQASIVMRGDEKCNRVFFIGKVLRKSQPRYTLSGYKVVDMTIEIDGKEQVTVIAFDGVADKCEQLISIGEMVWCRGIFLSRMYEKEMPGGYIVRKCTTEITLVYIEKFY